MHQKKTHTIKKVGFYDSGLGGLFVMKHVQKSFPWYDYVFLGDEKNLPYGEKTVEELEVYARKCITFLIQEELCEVVVVACNTLSATVYTTLEQEFRLTHPDVLLLDSITPTIDALDTDTEYTIFGTTRTIQSHIYKNEIEKRYQGSLVNEIEVRNLASYIEEKKDSTEYLSTFVPLMSKNPQTCILACTHYGIHKDVFKKVFPQCTTMVSQEIIILDLLKFILYTDGTGVGSILIYTTKKTPVFEEYVTEWFKDVPVVEVDVC